MKAARTKLFTGKLTLFLAGLAVSVWAAEVTADETVPVRIKKCQQIEDYQERLGCYDGVAVQLEAQKAEEGDSERPRQPTVADVPEVKSAGGSGTGEGDSSALDRRLQFEEEVGDNSFIIIPHLPNYILLYSYNHTPNYYPSSPTQEESDSYKDIKRSETKFQISFKVQLARNMMPERSSLWFAYTQRSFWQLYDRAGSAPFRESNYEPEMIFLYRSPYSLFGFESENLVLGLNHQSNGRADPLSRSWNRIYSAFLFSKGNLSLLARPWWRIPEDEADDDNPDIERYMGYAEFGLTYKREERDDVINLRFFNNLRMHDNKTSVELSYSFPLGGRIKGFIQYYNGYGESLLDYNHRTHRIGFGVLLTDWY